MSVSWRAGELKPIPGLVSTQSQGTNNHLESTMAQTCMFWEMGMWKQDWNAGPTHSGPLSHQCCILCFLSIKHATSGGWVLKEMLQPKVGRRVSWTGWIWTTAVLFRGGKNNALLMPVSGLVVDHRHSSKIFSPILATASGFHPSGSRRGTAWTCCQPITRHTETNNHSRS